MEDNKIKENNVENKPKSNRFKEGFKQFFSKENWTKDKVVKNLKKYIVLTIANLLLALSVVLFMNPLTIVSGGLTGIAIVIETFIPGDWLDVIVYCGEAILIVLSFIFLGRKTTLKSLYSCIICPLFITLFTRVIPISEISNLLYGFDGEIYTLAKDTSLLLLGGLVGGILTGLAVGFAFMVGGSTAGVDTIVLIIKKYVPRAKESILCFMVDSLIIVAGIITTFVNTSEVTSYNIVICFINIMTALVTAGTIEALYLMRNSSVTITIISEKWEEINQWIIKDLDRGSTVYPVYGGYHFTERKEIKTIVSKKQSEKAKEEILKIDPNCFLTMTVSKGVFGEGFQKRFSDD